jgi:hypothetical protein
MRTFGAATRYWGEHVFKGVTTPALTFIFDKGREPMGGTIFVEKTGMSATGIFLSNAPWYVSVRHSEP